MARSLLQPIVQCTELTNIARRGRYDVSARFLEQAADHAGPVQEHREQSQFWQTACSGSDVI